MSRRIDPGALGRRWRTVRRLDPSQVVHRLQLRGGRALDETAGGRRPRRRLAAAPVPRLRAVAPVSREAALHPPEEAEAFSQGRVEIHHQVQRDGIDWFPSWPRLALMHLHYFDWLWAYAGHPDRAWAGDEVVRILRRWADEVTPGRWMPWHPYVVACRGWNLAAVLPDLLDEVPDDLARLVWFHGDQLTRNLERDVRGNHLVRDLRALVVLGLVCGEPGWTAIGVGGLERAVAEQVLADGGHHERSPYYHAQVEVDLEEVCELLADEGAASPSLLATLGAMRRWSASTSPPGEGRLPVFNDGLHHDERHRRPGPARPDGVADLAASGYGVVRRGPWWVMVDVGTPSPRTLPAHGHCSLLSLELDHAGAPLLVNTGSSTYDDLAVRAAERGTACHNTVMVDGEEQSEVWDRFRTGRQAEPFDVHVRAEGDVDVVAGAHDGYRRLDGAPVHRRAVFVGDQQVRVVDRVEGRGPRRAEGRWQLAPGRRARLADEGIVAVDDLVLRVAGADRVEVVPAEDERSAWVALDYGRRQPVDSIRWSVAGDGPLEVLTELAPRH